MVCFESMAGMHVLDSTDDEKEEQRRQRRTMFSLSDWRRHRSGARYLHHVTTIVESGVVKAIVKPVMYVTLLATVIACYCASWAAKASWLPSWAPAAPSIAIEPIQLTSIALSLLLVFRTNASYARWEEARRKFGAITTTSRDVARQAFSWVPTDTEGGASKAAAARWLMALCRSCMCHLRGDEHDLREELQGILRPQELEWLRASQHRPSFCLQMLTRIMAGARLPNELLIRVDENMSKMVEAVSACERIINTPVPLSYTRHTARYLMAWLACVPFTLWNYCGWAMIPFTALISFVLLGIEEIGVYIEEPFSVMALERLCDRVDVNITTMLRDQGRMDEYMQQLHAMPTTIPVVSPPPSQQQQEDQDVPEITHTLVKMA